MRTVFPSTMKVTRSPLDTPSTSRTSFRIVICPFAMTLALSTNAFANMILHHLSETWQVGISLLSECQKTLESARGPQPSRKKTSPTACTSGSVLIFVSGNPISQSKNRFLAVSAPESVDIISDAQIALYMYLYLYFFGLPCARYTLSQTYPSASVHIFARKWRKNWCKLQVVNLL